MAFDPVSAAKAQRASKDAAQALLLSRNVTYVDLSLPVADQIRFVKSSANPILTTPDTDQATIDWPWIIRVDGFLDAPLGRYYLFFATDHGEANGRILLAYADELAGPWTYYGPVYQYNLTPGGSGTETETPAVIWDAPNDRFVMYHQQVGPTGAIAAQVTMRATSPDGITWTAGGIALDIPATNPWPAPGHTGYFRPFRVGDQWIAYSLLSGTSYGARFALSYSRDGVKFELDPRPLGYGAEWLGNNYRIDWNTSSVVLWRGRYLWIGIISTFASGAQDRDSYFAIAPLADDFRSLTAPPRKLWSATQPWESAHMSAGHFFIDDGALVGAYRSGAGTGPQPIGFGLVTAEAI